MAGASGCTMIESPSEEGERETHLSWYIVIKVSSILKVAEIGTRMAQNIDEYSPNQLHERMGAPVKLFLVRVVKESHFDQFCSVDTTSSP